MVHYVFQELSSPFFWGGKTCPAPGGGKGGGVFGGCGPGLSGKGVDLLCVCVVFVYDLFFLILGKTSSG